MMLEPIRQTAEPKMKLSRTSRAEALTVIELLIVIACLGILWAPLIPGLARPNNRKIRGNWNHQLETDGLAFRTWGLDNGGKYPMQVSITNGGTMEWVERGVASVHFQVMSNELSTPKVLLCPADAGRRNADLFQTFNNSHLSYFVGAEAENTNPQGLLSGDANLLVGGVAVKGGLLELGTNQSVGWSNTRHVLQGNFALADGSVQGVANARLRSLLIQTGLSTNRLLIP